MITECLCYRPVLVKQIRPGIHVVGPGRYIVSLGSGSGWSLFD